MTLGDVHVAVSWIGHDVGWIGQRLGRISSHAGLAEGHQHLAVRTELDDHTSLLVLARELLEFLNARRTRVSHPHVTLSIHVDAMRPDEHPAAEASDLLA